MVIDEWAELEWIDILSIHERKWIAQHRNLYREFLQLFERIRRSPGEFGWFDRVHRFARLSATPFLVYFEERNDEIVIAAIVHKNRAPGFWKKRRRP